MEKPILIIDPGHGGTDPGAVSTELEKDWTLKISRYQLERFKQLGVPVALTRAEDVTMDSGPRTKAVRDSGAKYCISNHLNAGGGNRGEVIHSMYNDGKLAHAIKAALEAAGQDYVKVYVREGKRYPGKDYYYMHRETGRVQTQIVEYCFIDNVKDFEEFKRNWKEYAEAVIKAFCSFTGYQYEAPKKEKPQPRTYYRVVTGSFSSKENAEERVQALKAAGFSSFIDTYEK